MSGFIEGENRFQTILLPESLDEYVGEEGSVRVLDYFIEHLDISGLGFRTEPNETGRPPYHPKTMLKIYVYGYLNQITTGRRLEREAQRNVELMWLTRRLAPDFKTILDFRKDNGEAIRLVCREFVMVCKKAGLLADAFVAIDGSKFKAVNNRDKNFTRAKMKRRLQEVEASIDRYMDQLADTDEQEPAADKRKLEDRLADLQREMDQLKKYEVRMHAAPDKQVSLTDPDARSMKSRGAGIVGYNVQIAADTKHHLIIGHKVTNTGSDRSQLSSVAKQAKEVMGVESLKVVADRGYYKGEELLACEEAGITTYVPKPLTSGNRAKGQFDKSDFIYKPDEDEYECPAGERVIYRFSTKSKGRVQHRYWSSACIRCAIKTECTTGKYRYVNRWEHEDVLDRAEARLKDNPDMMEIRRATAEHPFGTLKGWMGYTHFKTKKLDHVSTEMSLHVLAYNMKRAINIMGVGALMAVMQA